MRALSGPAPLSAVDHVGTVDRRYPPEELFNDAHSTSRDEQLLPPDVLAVLRRVSPHPHFAMTGAASAHTRPGGRAEPSAPSGGATGWHARASACRPTPARLVRIARALASEANAAELTASPSADASSGGDAVLLTADAWHEAWLSRWPLGHSTGTHDHAGATAALCVVRGRLELRTRGTSAGRADTIVTLTPGAVRVIGSLDVHELRNIGDTPAASIHVYAPRRALRAID